MSVLNMLWTSKEWELIAKSPGTPVEEKSRARKVSYSRIDTDPSSEMLLYYSTWATTYLSSLDQIENDRIGVGISYDIFLCWGGGR